MVFGVPYVPSVALLDRPDVNCEYVIHGDDVAVNLDGTSVYDAVRREGTASAPC